MNYYFCNTSGKAAGDSSAQEAGEGKRKASSKAEATQSADPSHYSHWLMKSEPESRFENGVDVKVRDSHLCHQPVPNTQTRLMCSASFWQFGIEDLKALPDQTGCWDGVRNYQVRPLSSALGYWRGLTLLSSHVQLLFFMPILACRHATS